MCIFILYLYLRVHIVSRYPHIFGVYINKSLYVVLKSLSRQNIVCKYAIDACSSKTNKLTLDFQEKKKNSFRMIYRNQNFTVPNYAT